MSKLIVIGFDGLEPSLLTRYWEQGRCGNLRRLRDQGGFRLLGTSTPAESPVAWSSFITGANPGRHCIFDFLHRDSRTYQPVLSLASTHAPARSLDFMRWRLPTSRARTVCGRRGQPFWHAIAAHGHPVCVLRVPVTYPPEPFQGRLLSSMGVPDLHGTQGAYHYWTTDPAVEGCGHGGDAVRIEFDGRGCTTELRPMPDPFRIDGRSVSVPVQLTRRAQELTVSTCKREVTLRCGEWSAWVKVAYRLSLRAQAVGWVRFLLVSLEPHVNLYCSPVNLDPHSSAVPISHPRGYAAQLQRAIGAYSTLGMAEDTWVLNEKRMDEAAFVASCNTLLDERERMLDFELQRFHSGLLICVFDQPDRIQHMFWRTEDAAHPARCEIVAARFGNAIRDVYERLDAVVGRIRMRAPDANLIVMSDHGCKPFRRAFHVNRWLAQQGHLAIDPEREAAAGADEDLYFRHVDLPRTNAYALGLSGVYLNLLGRERYGRVTTGAMAERLKQEIIAGLTALQDPVNGERVVSRVMRREEIFDGPGVPDAPDLIVGYQIGYRASWQTALGGAPPAIIEDNLLAWSGDHCIDPALVPGVLLSDLPLTHDPVNIIDVAPTIHAYFGVAHDPAHEGSSFWRPASEVRASA